MTSGLTHAFEAGVLTLALARPERRNAMDIEMTRALFAALESATLDRKVRCVLLTGHERGRGFCAGSDLKALSRLELAEMIGHEREMGALARSLNRYPKPIVAAVDGFAIGGGLVYAASCDVVFSSRTAKWALPETALGWNAAWGIAALRARLGPVVARHVLWGADAMDGVEAHRLGLCDFLQEAVLPAARAYAGALAALPTHAVQAAKLLSTPTIAHDAACADDRAMAAFADCLQTESAQKTLQSFGMESKKQ